MKHFYNLFDRQNISDLFLVEKKYYIDLAEENNIEIIAKFSTNIQIGYEKISKTIMKNIINNTYIEEVAVCRWKNEIKSGLTVILNNLNDYGNIGSIIRNCKAFGIKSIIIQSPFNIWNHKLIEASRGLIFELKPYITKEIDFSLFDQIYITDVSSETSNIVFNDKTAIIFGNETHGVDKEFYNYSSGIINIKCEYESLNVSVANGIILHDIYSKLSNNNSIQ